MKKRIIEQIKHLEEKYGQIPQIKKEILERAEILKHEEHHERDKLLSELSEKYDELNLTLQSKCETNGGHDFQPISCWFVCKYCKVKKHV